MVNRLHDLETKLGRMVLELQSVKQALEKLERDHIELKGIAAHVRMTEWLQAEVDYRKALSDRSIEP